VTKPLATTQCKTFPRLQRSKRAKALDEVDVDPSKRAGVVLEQDVIVADVAVTQPVVIQQLNRLASRDGPCQKRRKSVLEVLLVRHLQSADVALQVCALDETNGTDEVAASVPADSVLHESRIAPHEVEDLPLLLRAPGADDPTGTYLDSEGFPARELEDVLLPVGQRDRALDPELGLIVDAEPPFPLVASHEEQLPPMSMTSPRSMYM
jgi:hypothetical protein